MRLSVIIPTYDRSDALARTLNLLLLQTLPRDEYEVIVINDGSHDDTEEVLEHMASLYKREGIAFQHFSQENSGPGPARNRGIVKATGNVLLFMGDDIWGAPTFLAAHASYHREHAEVHEAALGLTTWSEEQSVTRFERWLTGEVGFRPVGLQFRFADLSDGDEVGSRRFYTSNISVKKALVGKERFDPAFRGWGLEDIEFGYRLEQKGMHLVFLPAASAAHFHPMTEAKVRARMERAGANAVLFQRLHPESDIVPSPLKRAVQFIAAYALYGTYWGRMKAAYLRGMRSALRMR